MLEDTLFRYRRIRNFFKNGKKHKTALFFPSFPSKQMVLYKVFRHLKYNITNNPELPHDIIIYWDDTTYRQPNSLIDSMAETERIINRHSIDISKTYVNQVFEQVFGYSSFVDPCSFHGAMVKKSEINARHDGEIVMGPVEPRDKYVYQKLIHNLWGDEFVADMRIPVINGEIPLVFVKYKSLSTRFGLFKRNHHKKKNTLLLKTEEILSKDEIIKLKAFCKSSGLDYGELDVLRDNTDGRIYVVDVNNTPTGPPYMNKQDLKVAMQIMIEVFKREFLR